jgi:hypothetical protein
MPVEPTPLERQRQDEYRRVRHRRFKEAMQAGLSLVEAKLFADSDIDVSRLRELVDGGCSAELIARILL